jgi:hypothetical protein
VRSEVGLLYGTKAAACYAVTVTFDDSDPVGRLRVMETLHRVGYDVLEHVS